MERWVDEIEGWETRSVADGYRGLRALADESFSGAVSAGGTWLFFVNGRAVGVFEYRQRPSGAEVSRGDVERFEDAALTTYEAPHPAIPLVVAMQAGESETRGKYYTEDTPISEVHATLEDGGFTGYLELSENVLSGDYYVVYQGGRSMEVAFIGNSRRLETDDDAFERAREEVGIYEVVAADLDIVDIPEPDDGDAVGAAAVAGGDDDPTAAAEDAPGDDEDAEGDGETEPATDPEPAPDQTPDDDDRPTSDPEPDVEDPDSGEPAEVTASTDADDSTADRSRESPPDRSQEPTPERSRESVTETEASTDAREATPTTDERDPLATPDDDAGGAIVDREVPSLDPERSGADGDGVGTVAESRADAATVQRDRADAERDRAAELERRLEEREAELEETRTRLDQVREERDDLRERVAELEAEIADLQSAVEAGGAGGADAAGGAEASLAPAEALSGTNLFVRYRSKGKTTLRDVHDGDGGPEALSENLRLEHHTEFETEGATVEGEPFEAWLHDSQPFRFLRWLTTTLPFEVRDTGAAEGMAALYDALPEIDRVELGGTVELPGEDGPRELGFDVVVRDRMGEPLAVCELDASREPVSEGQLAELVNGASGIAEREDTLAGAFFVTGSYFDPDALDTAREATSGSLLSRDKRRSFVKLSRKRGYHLCLVESRDGEFHLSVPDL